MTFNYVMFLQQFCKGRWKWGRDANGNGKMEELPNKRQQNPQGDLAGLRPGLGWLCFRCSIHLSHLLCPRTGTVQSKSAQPRSQNCWITLQCQTNMVTLYCNLNMKTEWWLISYNFPDLPAHSRRRVLLRQHLLPDGVRDAEGDRGLSQQGDRRGRQEDVRLLRQRGVGRRGRHQVRVNTLNMLYKGQAIRDARRNLWKNKGQILTHLLQIRDSKLPHVKGQELDRLQERDKYSGK